MTEDTKDTQRTRFMLINLALLGALILCLVAAIVIYNQIYAPSITDPSVETSIRASLTSSLSPRPSLTQTPTNTLLPTYTPTLTLTPTRTSPPEDTPTPPGPATLIPLQVPYECTSLPLKDWSAHDADHMIALMRDYPNTLSEKNRGEYDEAYYQAFEYAVSAAQEGLLRFPDATQADTWRWGLAYDLARTGSDEASEVYAEIIASALNSGETDISTLYTWFQQKEPHLTLHMLEIEPPAGYIRAFILELMDTESGSAFIWLLESSGAFRSFSLFGDFDFIEPRPSSWIISELNNDPSDDDELAIYQASLTDTFVLETPLIYNLSEIPHQELPLIPELNPFIIGMEYTNYWAVQPNSSGGNDLIFQSDIYPACPVSVQRVYHWNSELFEFDQATYSLEQTPIDLSFCDFIAQHASSLWGPDAGVAIMEPLLSVWPPEQDVEGNPYPADAFDEWRFRLGVNYALLGEVSTARQHFSDIIDNPSTSLSRWIKPASDFLEIYQSADDIYRACITTEFCEPKYAIRYLMEVMPSGEDALTYLRSSGVNTFATGFFDFDDDDVRENWFTVRHRPLESLEFWILAVHPEGVKPLYSADVQSRSPDIRYLEPEYISPDALHLQPVVFLDSTIAFSLQRAPGTLEPYLVDVPLRQEYPNRFLIGLQISEEALFSGASPSSVQNNLLGLEDYPGLLCEGTWSCDPYYYLVGLSSELAGDETESVNAYCTLWSDYSKSPYTTMARLKLVGGAVTPTPTATNTPTRTPTQSATPTPTGSITPTLTFTPTLTGTLPTPTITLSPTITNTGQPQTTPTPSATHTTIPYPGPTVTPVTPYP